MTAPDSRQSDVKSSDEKPTRKRGWRRLLLFMLLALLVLIAIAPNLLGWSGQLTALINKYAPLNGELKIEDASLGWFQSIKLSGVSLQDENGETVLIADRIESSKSLLNIALNSDKPGEFTVGGAEVALVTWPGGSNLESVLAPTLDPGDEAESETVEPSAAVRLPQVAIKITNSHLKIRKRDSQRWANIEDLNAELQIQKSANDDQLDQIQFAINANSADEGSGIGTIIANGELEMSGDQLNPVSAATAQLTSVGLSSAVASPILHRLDQDVDVHGTLDSSFTVKLAGTDDIQISVKALRANGLNVVSRQDGAEYPVSLKQIKANGSLQIQQSRFSARKFQLKSDVANLTFDGIFDPAEIVAAATGGRKLESDFSVNGNVDMAMLSRLVPQFLDVRDDIELDEAVVNLEAFSRMESGQRRVLMNFELPTFSGRQFDVVQRGDTRHVNRNKSRKIRWPDPVRVTVAARQDGAPLWLELLTCESDFFSAQGSTAPDGRGQLTFNGDLARLRTRLNQFFDLSQMRLAGELSGQFDWSKLTNAQFEQIKIENGINTQNSNMPVLSVSGGCTIREFLFGNATDLAMREDELVMKLGFNQAYASETSRLETAAVQITTGNDQARATLARPVRKPDLNSNYLIDVQVDGDLKTWVRRARAFVELPRMNAGGRASLIGQLDYGPERIAFKSSDVSATDVLIAMPSMKIREPKIEAVVDVLYDINNQQMVGKRVTAKTDASAVGCENLTIDLAGEKLSIKSHLALIVDMQETMGWIKRGQQLNPYRGKMLGSADLNIDGPIVYLDLDTKVENFEYLSFNRQPDQNRGVPESSTVWAEKLVAVTGQARYNTRNDALGLKSAVIKAEGIAVDLHGRIEELTSICDMNIAGTLQTDSALMVQRLRENIGIDLQMVGNDTSNISVKGPLFAPDTPEQVAGEPANNGVPAELASARTAASAEQLNARMQVRWESGRIYGLPFGKGRVAMRYDPQQLEIDPIKIPLEKGRINVDPAVLFGDQMMLNLRAGKLVNRANLSPELCRSWMKFVAPMIAEATHAEGTFSLDLNRNAMIPLSDPLGGDMDATVSLHEANVGPGPLGVQMITIAKRVKSIVQGESIVGSLLTPANDSTAQSDTQNRVWIRMPEQQVDCRVQDGRVHHALMTFAIGDVMVQTSGSVGSDQTIDMEAIIPIHQEWLEKNKLIRSLAGNTRSVTIPIRGTVSKPQMGTDGLAAWSKQFLRGAARNYLKDKAGRFLEDSAGKLLEQGTGDLLRKPDGTAPDGNQKATGDPLKDAAGKLLEDQLREGLNRLIKPPK